MTYAEDQRSIILRLFDLASHSQFTDPEMRRKIYKTALDIRRKSFVIAVIMSWTDCSNSPETPVDLQPLVPCGYVASSGNAVLSLLLILVMLVWSHEIHWPFARARQREITNEWMKMWSPDWNVSMGDIHLRKLLCVYWPGHAGVKGNDRTDTLAGKATLTSGLLLERSEVLRSLRHYLRAQCRGYHTIDRLEERGVERGSARWSSLKGRERAIVSQTNNGTVWKATLGKRLSDGLEHIWVFPSA